MKLSQPDLVKILSSTFISQDMRELADHFASMITLSDIRDFYHGKSHIIDKLEGFVNFYILLVQKMKLYQNALSTSGGPERWPKRVMFYTSQFTRKVENPLFTQYVADEITDL